MLQTLRQWVKRISGLGWTALACLLLGAFWLQQHDARVRQQVQLQQVQRQTSAEVAALQKQARLAVKQANVENARAVQQLEARRRLPRGTVPVFPCDRCWCSPMTA